MTDQGDKVSGQTMERDGKRGNLRVKIQARAREILRNGSSLLSMADAVELARVELEGGARFEGMDAEGLAIFSGVELD